MKFFFYLKSKILEEDQEEALNSTHNGIPNLMLKWVQKWKVFWKIVSFIKLFSVGIIGKPTHLFNMKALILKGKKEDGENGEFKNE